MSVTSVLVLQHYADSPPGLIGEAAAARGIHLEIIDAAQACTIPADAQRHHGLLVLGGVMSAHDDHLAPHFPALLDLARAFAAAEKPVLGICLGGQLLARAFGGRVHRHRAAEFGFLPVHPTPAAASDPLLAGSRTGVTVMQWHDDSFDPPPDAVPLLEGSPCRSQAFRVGRSVWGFQGHLEVTRATALAWAELRATLRGEPQARAILARQMTEGWAETEAFGRLVAGRWLDLCRGP
jgi:GMP synthase-like glutamine amidotransferase